MEDTFAGQWEIRTDSHVTVKTLHWKIEELMQGSPYKDRFRNGLFMHAFLGPNDYRGCLSGGVRGACVPWDHNPHIPEDQRKRLILSLRATNGVLA